MTTEPCATKCLPAKVTEVFTDIANRLGDAPEEHRPAILAAVAVIHGLDLVYLLAKDEQTVGLKERNR